MSSTARSSRPIPGRRITTSQCREGRENVWVYTQPQTGDRLYAYDVDFTVTADYYKGDPNGGYRSFVFTDFLSSEQLVQVRDQHRT